MTQLRFHRQIYRGTAVDEAVKSFGAFADFALTEEPDYWVVQLTAKDPDPSGQAPRHSLGAADSPRSAQLAARERKIAGELGNWALGLTVQKRGR
jgi:hypothetical protein